MDATNEALIKFLMAYLGIVIGIGLVVWLIQTIAMWKLFSKAGEAGWKAIIPIYNMYIYFKIAGIPNVYWLLLLVSVLTAIPNPIVVYACLVIGIVITFYHASKISKAFGHGLGYTLGLLFLNTIFLLILGFGSSKYELKND